MFTFKMVSFRYRTDPVVLETRFGLEKFLVS